MTGWGWSPWDLVSESPPAEVERMPWVDISSGVPVLRTFLDGSWVPGRPTDGVLLQLAPMASQAVAGTVGAPVELAGVLSQQAPMAVQTLAGTMDAALGVAGSLAQTAPMAAQSMAATVDVTVEATLAQAAPMASQSMTAEVAEDLTVAGELAQTAPMATQSMAATLAGALSYADEVLADSPVGYWRLGDSGATAVDAAGSSDGTWSGSRVPEEPGVTADGDTAVRISAADGSCALGTPQHGQTNLTLEIWFKGTTTASIAQLFSAESSSSLARSWQFRLSNTGGDKPEFVKVANGVATVTGTTVITDGDWHHLVVTYDGSTIRLYVDGVLDNSGSASGAITAGTAATLRLGENVRGDAAIGTYDEAALYDYALSAARIADHYAAAAV